MSGDRGTPRTVALLRGVNVGGRGRLPMAELRDLFSELGLADVATYLQSGNVLFRGAVTVGQLEAAIAGRFGLDAAVVLRSAGELAVTVAGQPFAEAPPAALHVGFLGREPEPAERAALADLDPGRHPGEEVAVRGRELYFHLPAGMGNAKLPAFVTRRLAAPVTVRNWRTVTTLADLAKG